MQYVLAAGATISDRAADAGGHAEGCASLKWQQQFNFAMYVSLQSSMLSSYHLCMFELEGPASLSDGALGLGFWKWGHDQSCVLA